MIALDRAKIEECLPMRGAIEAMRTALHAMAQGEVYVPERTRWQMGSIVVLLQAASSEKIGLAVIKLLTICPENVSIGLPAIHGSLTAFDCKTGEPLASLDAETITELRTGACSAIATDLLAREGARTLAVFGYGPQAEAQIAGVLAVRTIEKVAIYARNFGKAKDRASRLAEKFGVTVSAENDRETLKSADIICTATNAKSPLFSAADVAPDVHINAVGSYRPDMCELPPDLVRSAYVVVDSAEFCATEAGDLLRAFDTPVNVKSHVTELGSIRHPEQNGGVTVYKSVGNAAQDLFAAASVLRSLR